MITKIILLRHGESEWNLSNQFTGWTDVNLTSKGISEATEAGKKILDLEISIDTIYTSLLKRAIDTAEIIAKTLNFDKKRIEFDWRLNERHYGALQGLNKSETALKYGEKQVKIWRRSFDIPPPPLTNNDKRHPILVRKFQSINSELPVGESLKDVINRLNPFWKSFSNEIKLNEGNHLIVAHSNSLRAIIKILEKLSDNEIVSVNIPTGVPLLYEFDQKFNLIKKEYLIDDETLKIKQKKIENQGKINAI